MSRIVPRLWWSDIEQCGWLRDRYGVASQIAPRGLSEMMRAPDPAAAKRVAGAML